ncbi:Cell division protein FtsK [Mucinivorans hirudinis]|uniref:Cell division protein FtsK n=1 Tax=Mucinivorans hirudinis TaxID=1433126 RepID=A0A060R7P3_9BACT|nr:Cell division protein FtsK [Mucinivorans hirudinis]
MNDRDKHIELLRQRGQQAKQQSGTGVRPAVHKPPMSKPTPPEKPKAEKPRAEKPKEMSGAPTRAARATRPTRPTSPKRSKAPKAPVRTSPSTLTPEQELERRFWWALPVFFIGAYLLIACVSYLSSWQADQSLTQWSNLFASKAADALNMCGKLGALTSHYIVGQWFGVFGLLLPVSLMVGSLKIMAFKFLNLQKTLRSLGVLMVVGSVAMGHFFGADREVLGSGLGGEMGIYSARWLEAIIGNEGTTLFISVVGLALLYFVNAAWLRRTVKSLIEYIDRRNELAKVRLAEQTAKMRIAAAEAAQKALAAEQEHRERVAEVRAQEAVSAVEPMVAPPVEPPVEQLVNLGAETIGIDIPGNPELAVLAGQKNENLIALDNGQWGYVTGADADGVVEYVYMDLSTLPPMLQKPTIAEKTEVDQPQQEEIQFIIKHRPAEDEREVLAPAVSITPVVNVIENNFEPQGDQPATRIVHFAPAPDDPNFIVEQIVSEEQVDDHLINLSEVYDPTLELRSYQKPPVELLQDHSKRVTVTQEELVENKNRIVQTLLNFGIEIRSIEATTGPTVTLYEIIPAPGVRISKIKNLEEDIALSLAALGIRIIAPMPGKGTIGIEVPNKNKEVVSMYSVIKSSRFQDTKFDLPIALGKNIQNETVVMDLAKMPHLLVAGATGQGKSVGLNAIITSLLYKKHPAELKFILVDPKKVELTLYSKLEKHFLAKMPDEDKAIITDTQKVIYTLNSVCIEMQDRYELLEAAKVRHIKEYNEKFVNRRLNPEKGHRYMPYFVVIIDEFADLIMTAGREVETPIARIAQLARAVGIHLIIATQRPSVNIITGVIRANFPARVAFRVATSVDSRTILDTAGANQLVGQGDMLVSNGNEIVRVQCAFIDTPEVDMITNHISSQKGYPSAFELPEYVPEGETPTSVDLGKKDALFDEVARFVVSRQKGSASDIQRNFSIGFNRAGRIVDQLEAAGIVGRGEGSKPRQVLVQDLQTLDIMLG